MDKLESYRDLCKEIELWEIRLWDLQTERDVIIRQMTRPPQTKLCANYDGMPKAGMASLDFAEAFSKVQRLDNRIAEAKDVLSLKRGTKKRMERVIGEFDSIEYKVAYLRDIERKPLKKIADELAYSYDWIRKISGRVKRLRIS